jgi:predicted RND superfamily exporter protein
LLAFLPLSAKPRAIREGGIADRVLIALGDLATRRPWSVLIASGALIAAAAGGVAGLSFSHNQMAWFPPSHPLRLANDTIDRELKGSISIEVIADTERENGMYEPELLRSLERVSGFAEAYGGRQFVGRTFSLADMVKEINQALNEAQPTAYRIPADRRLIAQELLLFENSGSDDLDDVTDSRFSQARLTAKAKWDDASAYVDFVGELNTYAAAAFGKNARIRVTGFLVLFTRAIAAMMTSMVTSYLISFLGIAVLMVIMAGNLRIGLLSMIPNIVPILFTLGLMGWLGLRLDLFTLLIGSIAIGLAVEDTIHYFHNFRRYYAATGDAREAVRQTLLGTGRAMLFGTAVLVAGFWLFMFASLSNLFNFGLLTGITLAGAFLADVVLASAMLALMTRAKWSLRLLHDWGGVNP